jgi:hypothetical protein
VLWLWILLRRPMLVARVACSVKLRSSGGLRAHFHRVADCATSTGPKLTLRLDGPMRAPQSPARALIASRRKLVEFEFTVPIAPQSATGVLQMDRDGRSLRYGL